MQDIREGHNRLGCFLLMWAEGRVGCRGQVPVYNHLWVAVAAEGSGDMLPFCVLVSNGGEWLITGTITPNQPATLKQC